MQFEKTIKIGNKEVSLNSPVFIIAEAGVNHGGDSAVARRLVDAAREAGADAVKFQAFKTENLILVDVEKAPYQQSTTGKGTTQYQMLKKLELRQKQNHEIKSYCKEKGIIFLATPFDAGSLEELEELEIAAYKVSSTDVNNLPFLRKVAEKNRPIILSTGMSYNAEVRAALQEIWPINKNVILLQCTANYPIADDEANLAVIRSYQRDYDMHVGYSDHTMGIGAAPYAVAMGAKVVEKHFTLDTGLEGPDQRMSLNPRQLKDFVTEIRKVERYLGTGIKLPTVSELETRKSLQKCIVAARDIAAGEIFNDTNLTAKRTGGKGISPIYYRSIYGKTAGKNFKKDEIVIC